MNGNAFFPLRLQLPGTQGDYYCARPRIRIGRNPDCDLVFTTSRSVSRSHAEIFFRNGIWFIRDTNSANGTYINGRRLVPGEECRLNPGDKIRLGDVTLEVLLTPASAPSGNDWRDSTIGFAPINPEALSGDSTVTISPGRPVGASITACPVCGNYFDSGSTPFCPACGSDPKVPRQPTRPRSRNDDSLDFSMFCGNCGSRASGRFCTMCGAPLRKDSTVFFDDSTVYLDEPESAPAPSMAPPPPSVSPRPAPSMAPPPPSMPPRPAPSMAPSAAPSMAPPPAKSAKKPGLFGRLFSGMQSAPAKPAAAPQRPVQPAAPPAPVQPAVVPPVAPPQTDDIQFRGAAPKSINPGEYFTVKIMMYREDDYQRADRETAAVADEVKAASSGVYQASRGQKFRIVLQSPDVELDTESETLLWNGVFAAADFEVYLPEDFDRKQLRLRGRVYSGDAVVTDLKLILQVSTLGAQQVVCEKVRLRSAFISYASADRAKVVARLQGIMLACPDMDLFFDVESLRRGEAWEPRLYKEISQRDLFYLFWSHNAAASEWVKKELEYAVSQKTVEFIEPIPLEQPDVCPPPESLMCKHFNDWTLRYLNNQ